jgi:cytochrome c biogenesis protein ResB
MPLLSACPSVICHACLLLQVEGLDIVVEGIVGSTGLELKSDPGVPLVYAGFGALMITTLISYISHSQVRLQEALCEVLMLCVPQ